MVRGRPQEEGPLIRVHTMREEGEPAYLFILTEGEGPDPETTCGKVAESLIQNFVANSGAVPARLQAAVKRTHESLLAENFRALPDQRATTGVICAYLRNPDLYLAYVGPSTAYLIGAHQARLFAPIPGDPAARLGSPRSQQVWTRHHRLLPDETLVLGTSSLAEIIDASTLYTTFHQGLEDGMATIYRLATGTVTFASVAISPQIEWEETDAKPALSAAPAIEIPNRNRPFAVDPFREPAEKPDETPLSGKPWEPLPSLNLGLYLDHKLPDRYQSRYTGRIARTVAAGVAGLFLFGGILAGTQAIASSNHERSVAQASALVEQAQTVWGQAQAAASKDERRQRLAEASQLLDESQLKASANESGAVGLIQQVRNALNDLDAIRPLQDVRLIADVPSLLGRQVLMRDPIIRGDRLAVLDKLGNQVLDLPLVVEQGGGARTVVAALYPAKGSDVPRLTELLSLPRSGAWPRDSVFVIDEGGGLTELGAAGEPRQVALRGIQTWQSFQAAASANGAIYILDPKGSQVARHAGLAAGTSFDTPTLSTPRTLELSDTVDLYVDTEMYILSKAGRVVKLSAGQPQPFNLDGLDQPLANPIAIASNAASKHIYVLDGNNKRVVVLSKQDGAFVRQHPIDDLPPIYTLQLDVDRGRLLLIGETKVYGAAITAD